MSVAAHGRSWRQRKHAPVADSLNAPAVIARTLNRSGPAEIVMGPVDAAVERPPAEAPPGDSADVGVTTHVPFGSYTVDDPLAAGLLALGNSLIYDLVRRVGAPGWDEIVVELPPGEPADFAMRAGEVWRPWHPSMHSNDAVEVFRALLDEVDPGVGYDLVTRPQEMIVCGWPHRAWDVRDSVAGRSRHGYV